RYILNLFKLAIKSENLEQVRICVMVTYFRLCKRIAYRANFRLRQAMVQVAPKRLNCDFYLRNRKHCVLNSVTLRLTYVNLIIVNIGRVVKLRMHPVGVTYSIDIFD